jgi:Protein of unknown function (DUF2934)
MKRKPSKPSSKSVPRKSARAATVSRNSPVPRSSSMKREITHEMIAKRAYEIFISGKGGTQIDNWLRAERELRTL